MNTSNQKELPPRNKVHDTHLRSIILRLDFQGVSDYRTLVNLFDKSYPKGKYEIFSTTKGVLFK